MLCYFLAGSHVDAFSAGENVKSPTKRRKRAEGGDARERGCGVSEGSYTLKWKWWHFGLSWVALCVDVFLFVPAAVRTLVSDEIEWSGIRYWKRNGLIRRVVHAPRGDTL